MKKIILILASIIFSTLFYQKYFGINLLLFSIVVLVVLAITNPKKIKEKKVILKAVLYLITAMLVFINHTRLNTITNLVFFFLLIGSVSETKTSTYMTLINGLYSTIVASFAHYFDGITNEIKQVKKQDINYKYWLKMIGIPLIVISIFIALYRNANPIFDTIISRIDFSFINLQWLLFTGLGYYLFYNISNPIQINPATEIDLKTTNFLNKSKLKEVSDEDLKSENQLGLVLMILLNILIVFLLITDVIYLNQNIENVSAVELSNQVHQGINSLIMSIVFAIILIIYFFRGNLNFYSQNKALKKATFMWILLNLVLVLFTVFKNYQYVHTFGFTYKRIGVFIYLILASFGLIFTYIKVNKSRNIVFLFRKNIEIAFAVLIISSFVNWDVFITNYNLNTIKGTELDISYLIELENNATILKTYKDNHTKHTIINYNNNKQLINSKYYQYQEILKNKAWQEKIFKNFKK